jgi:hypothetical protein
MIPYHDTKTKNLMGNASCPRTFAFGFYKILNIILFYNTMMNVVS